MRRLGRKIRQRARRDNLEVLRVLQKERRKYEEMLKNPKLYQPIIEHFIKNIDVEIERCKNANKKN